MPPFRHNLHVYYHTHWDREWYSSFRTYQLRLVKVVDALLDALKEEGLPCFMLDGQTVILEDYLELRPDQEVALKYWIETGRLRIGPWYVMPDEFLVSGESLIRNLIRGIRQSKAWGCSQWTGYLPDTFGHSADIPTILKQVGIHSAVVWRGVNPQESLFQWQSPDGSSVTTLHLTDGYFQMALHDWTITREEGFQVLDGVIDKLIAAQNDGLPGPLVPIGGDHLNLIGLEAREALKVRYLDMVETTPDQFLAEIENLVGASQSLNAYVGELTDNTGSFLLPGVYSARLYLKQRNRQMEHRLIRQLEPLQAMATVGLVKQQRHQKTATDLAWKLLLLNHPHDSICGCSIDSVHRENESRFDQVDDLTQGMMSELRHAFCQELATGNEWLVLNTGTTAYTGVVRVVEDVTSSNSLENDSLTALQQIDFEEEVLQDEYQVDPGRIPLSHLTQTRRHGWIFVKDVPPMGFLRIQKAYMPLSQLPSRIEEKQRQELCSNAMSIKTWNYGMENSLLSVQVNLNDGTLTIQELQTGVIYPNLLQFIDQADQGDSYNSAPVIFNPEDPETFQKPIPAQFLSCRIIHRGPLVATLELGHQLESLIITTEVSLQAQSPYLSFKTQFTNKTTNHRIQVIFPTSSPIECVVAESHLGVVKRYYDPNFRVHEHMPAASFQEIKPNTGPIQRFFSANGQSWMTKGLTEYEIQGNGLSITLLRAFGALSKKNTGVRGAQAGPPFETPEGQCLNRHFVCEYAWLPTPKETHPLYEIAGRYEGNLFGSSGSGSNPASGSSSDFLYHSSSLQRGEVGRGEAHEHFEEDSPSPTILSHSWLQWDNPHVIAQACYPSKSRTLLIRLINTISEKLQVRFSFGFSYRSVRLVDFLEVPVSGQSDVVQSDLVQSDLLQADLQSRVNQEPFSLMMAPLDVKTLLIEVL